MIQGRRAARRPWLPSAAPLALAVCQIAKMKECRVLGIAKYAEHMVEGFENTPALSWVCLREKTLANS